MSESVFWKSHWNVLKCVRGRISSKPGCFTQHNPAEKEGIQLISPQRGWGCECELPKTPEGVALQFASNNSELGNLDKTWTGRIPVYSCPLVAYIGHYHQSVRFYQMKIESFCSSRTGQKWNMAFYLFWVKSRWFYRGSKVRSKVFFLFHLIADKWTTLCCTYSVDILSRCLSGPLEFWATKDVAWVRQQGLRFLTVSGLNFYKEVLTLLNSDRTRI